MAGEEAIVHERLVSVTSAGAGELAAKVVKDDRTIRRKDDKFETEKVVLVDSSDEHESIVGWGCYPNNEKSIQPHPSPEFLNSLSFIKKFYPVLNLLHAPRVPQKQRGCSLLHLLAIRTRCTLSVRKFATPRWGEGELIKVTSENSCYCSSF